MKALKKMPNNNSPGNDGITKEFYEAFWADLKISLLLSVNKAFKVEELSTSQKQAVIKLIQKRDGLIKTYFSSRWLKIRFKSFNWAAKNCASFHNTAYLNGKFISERGPLISDIFEVSDLLRLKGLTFDIEKAFDSVNRNFLLKVLENYGFS